MECKSRTFSVLFKDMFDNFSKFIQVFIWYMSRFSECQSINECLAIRDNIMNTGEILEIKENIAKATDSETKKELGGKLNALKKAVQEECDVKVKEIQAEQEKNSFTEFDPTFYSEKYKTTKGTLHPITLVLQEIQDIFGKMGFDVFNGPIVLDQWYNFTSVNTPDYHPARDMQDTFFIKQKDANGEHYVMRTQATSNITRYAKTHEAPFRVIFPGLTFRNENIDATHDINFFQFDMWLVDKKASISQLTTIIQRFFSEFFQSANMTVRLRPSYFPFVNPGLEADSSCPFCGGKGCRTCKHAGWIEVCGAGPIHRKVLQNCGINPDEYQGIAFGFGVDRLVQLKLGMTYESQFYNGGIKFIKGN